VAIVAYLRPGVQLLPRLSVAVAEVAVIVGNHDVAGGRDCRRIFVEIELLEAVVAMCHDDNRGSRATGAGAIEPTPQSDSLGIELDVGDVV
jgi:hypothetical protein